MNAADLTEKLFDCLFLVVRARLNTIFVIGTNIFQFNLDSITWNAVTVRVPIEPKCKYPLDLNGKINILIYKHLPNPHYK